MNNNTARALLSTRDNGQTWMYRVHCRLMQDDTATTEAQMDGVADAKALVRRLWREHIVSDS